MWTNTKVLLIVLASLANWLPKIFPYLLMTVAKLPEKAVAFLSYLPISIMFALILSGIFTVDVARLPQLKTIESLALLPTYLTLKKTNNMLLTVVVGVACVAILRLVSGA